jgi:hypothetical protein
MMLFCTGSKCDDVTGKFVAGSHRRFHVAGFG